LQRITTTIMNGLLSIYSKQSSSELGRLLDAGLNFLTHRGTHRPPVFTPSESETSFIAGSCSKLDDASHIARSGDSVLYFDGKLLNKAQLCNELSLSVESSTDADVALSLTLKYRERGFRRLYGYWTLIFYDALNRQVYAARDHFGARPLYYCNTDGFFALCNESRPLYSLFDDTHTLNRNNIMEFLLWGRLASTDQYFFRDIHSVEPSYYVKYDIASGQCVTLRYYTLPYSREDVRFDTMAEQTYLDRIRELLTESVQANLAVHSGALAVGVSGGMDSASLICTAHKAEPQRTLVAYTTTDNYDGGEIAWAEKVVRHVNAEWFKVTVTPDDILSKLSDVNYVHNVPLYNASSLAQFRIMEEIEKQGQAVFIDGQGGDEMLGGYQSYFPLMLNSHLRRFALGSLWHEFASVGNSGITLGNMFTDVLKTIGKSVYYTPLRLAQQKRRDEYDSLMPEVRDAYFRAPAPVHLEKSKVLNDALSDSYTVYLANVLRWGEHSAAAKGIECVMPLSDYPPLAEYVFSVPSVYKIHDGWNKYLLRKAMEGTVPDEICRRKQKYGFYIPELRWLAEMGDAMFDVIRTTPDPEECINVKVITENFKRLFNSNNPNYQKFIFRCYSYLLWRQRL